MALCLQRCVYDAVATAPGSVAEPSPPVGLLPRYPLRSVDCPAARLVESNFQDE